MPHRERRVLCVHLLSSSSSSSPSPRHQQLSFYISVDYDLNIFDSAQMVLLVTTRRILSAIEAIPSSRRKDLDLPESPGLNAAISHDQLIGLSRYLKSSLEDGDRTPWTLNSLLRGTKVYVPPPPKKPEPVRIQPTPQEPRTNVYILTET